ncbi:dnaJ homolog subfamily C member 17 [Monomorium pharaonis]|uniref:dnaJ homolog subfamily C member 17 n=1 Tax=Monomorium pharaonis TaxID=307658 RepID=UPI00063EED27|nr:dnaJ homolog subfamily C member 17 [Monomorium pharaonis]
MDEITQLDLYGLLGVASTASISEIKKAYRKKALTCHPDKNPDNPRAAELFQELSRILEILTDVKARAAYDQAVTARNKAKERIRQFDKKRKRFKDELEAREEAFKRSFDVPKGKSEEDPFKMTIKELQDWYKKMEEEMMFTRKLFSEKLCKSDNSMSNIGDFRIKLKWKVQDGSTNGGYNYDNLYQMFSKYGNIAALVISSTKKGSAMVEFKEKNAAEMAVSTEIGLAKNPLTLRGLWDTQKRSTNMTSHNANFNTGKPTFPVTTFLNSTPCASVSFSAAPDIFMQQQPRMSDAEYENSVLTNLRRTQERKRLIEELKAQEDIGTEET